MSFRSFPMETPEGEDPVIEIGGVKLRCIPDMPVKVAAEWDEERRFSYPGALVRTLKSVVVDEDQEVLQELLDDRETPVTMRQMDEIVGWLFHEYARRPTKPSSDSSPGGTPTPGGSTDGSSSVASTSTASTPGAP